MEAKGQVGFFFIPHGFSPNYKWSFYLWSTFWVGGWRKNTTDVVSLKSGCFKGQPASIFSHKPKNVEHLSTGEAEIAVNSPGGLKETEGPVINGLVENNLHSRLDSCLSMCK